MLSSSKLLVQNLSLDTTDELLKQTFEAFGQVIDSIHMRDRETGRARGFGFVTMSTLAEAESAIAGLNEQELDGHRLRVKSACSVSETEGAGGGYGGAQQGGE
ncbi:Glycine-rich rna binding [Mycena chlorophos]|uniref:Glycine-rich rna binding n=1 Tax=Mycena chlorophos TaxID=658473 RepID=A0A8H6SLX1_MYCCL|nr:Glycine-rich rna binding [Mycena chlorophos]